MVLLNALIAIMSDAATAAADTGTAISMLNIRDILQQTGVGLSLVCSYTDGTKFLASKAEIIDELEQSIPKWHRSADWYA